MTKKIGKKIFMCFLTYGNGLTNKNPKNLGDKELNSDHLSDDEAMTKIKLKSFKTWRESFHCIA